ncbi:MAG: EamA/RhaT family transporter, partial [Synergistales bacterium]|nr:EamA/RhaT family transporter [Synergistales bacterium]
VMPFLIQPMAQRYSPDTHAAILQSTECLWGYAIAIFIGEEMLNWQVFLGGMIIFFGVMVTESEIYFRKRQERRKASQVDLPEQA